MKRANLRHLGVLASLGMAFAVLPAESAVASPANEEVRVITGRFEPGAPDWGYVPVDIPAGVREIAVRYSYDRPATPPGVPGNALDIGMFDNDGYELGNAAGFRGWSGGARDNFTISRSDATPGYVPGPITPGRWNVILGPYTVAPQGMEWRVEVTLRYGEPGPAFVPHYSPTRISGRGPGWYRGDLHVHSVYSDGKRTAAEVAAAARASQLDFFVSTEHNTQSAHAVWGDYAGTDLLIVTGEEVTTRNGHLVAAGLTPGQWIDWRYRAQDGQLPRFLREIHRSDGVAIAAHPFATCGACDWKFGYEGVDAVEIWNGPWTAEDEQAVNLWDGMLRDHVQGKGPRRWRPAVGSSDAHREPQIIGLPQTVVEANELSRRAILDGVAEGRSYIAESAQVKLEMNAQNGLFHAGIGERLLALPHSQVGITVTVSGAPGTTVRLVTDRGEASTFPVASADPATFTWTTFARDVAYVRAEVRRPNAEAVALSNPIFVGLTHPAQ